MSSFICQECNKPIVDTPQGYVTECEHWPLPFPAWRREDAPRAAEVGEDAVRSAKELVSEPDARAKVKVALCTEGKTLLADQIDAAVVVAREYLRLMEALAYADDASMARIRLDALERIDKRRHISRPAIIEACARVQLKDEEVEWVVNDIAELGVKIGNQFFFMYKGYSLVYGSSEFEEERPKDGICKHDDGTPMHYRPVGKREFGECCHPLNREDYSKIGTVSLSDSDEWKPLPAAIRALAPGGQNEWKPVKDVPLPDFDSLAAPLGWPDGGLAAPAEVADATPPEPAIPSK